jgi:hypothetical protein
VCLSGLHAGFGLVIGFIGILQLVSAMSSGAIAILQSVIQCSTRSVFSVSRDFTIPLVTASNGGCSPYSGFPNYPRASATAILVQLPHNFSSLNENFQFESLLHTELLSNQSYVTIDGKSILVSDAYCYCFQTFAGVLIWGSLTRGRVSILQLLLGLASAVIPGCEYHVLPSHI